ncbi:MAG: tetratricopeptide repeat protein [Rhodospirillales bacterium]|jgi:tetratricopeptide (TPR) repeat protein|nr:tetratricopeptide repeat protein [Rhodospirillales bacterium]
MSASTDANGEEVIRKLFVLLDELALIFEAGDTARAEKVLREVVAKAPAAFPVHKRLADVLIARRRFDEADTILLQALETAPNDLSLLEARVRARPDCLEPHLGFVRGMLHRAVMPIAEMALDFTLREFPDSDEAWRLARDMFGDKAEARFAVPAAETVLFGSPRNCGGGWAKNALIELGIRVDSVPHEVFFRLRDLWGGRALHTVFTEDAQVKAILPSLFFRKFFVFDRRLFVQATNHYPLHPDYIRGKRALLNYRNPCDSILSAHRFLGSKLAFADFARGAVRDWRAAFEPFLAAREVHLIHFKEYHQRPHEVLTGITGFLGIEAGEDAISSAVHHSCFENTRLAETAFHALGLNRPQHPGVYAYGGRSGDHKKLPEHAETFAFIHDSLADLIERFET